MKYIKRFESKSFNKGDYVVLKHREITPLSPSFQRYAQEHVGKIIKINYIGANQDLSLSILWQDLEEGYNLPQWILDKKHDIVQVVSDNDIEFSSKDRNEAENFLKIRPAIKKFNV